MPWSTAFEDPVPLPDGGELVTFYDAAEYMKQLSASEMKDRPWQIAGHILIAAAEGRDFNLHARIAVYRAIHGRSGGEPRERRRPKKYNLIR